MNDEQRHYLKLLAELFPNIPAASTEIVNLSSIINLPKGTEHFVSDLHGAYDAFSHVLRNGSGAVRRKVEELFSKTLSGEDIRTLCTLIYYPRDKMALVKESLQGEALDAWYKVMLYRLIAVCRYSSSKYTRSKVRKALPEDFRYVIEELITEREEIEDKELYYEEIVNTIIRTGAAERCISQLAYLIQRLVIDHLHVVGDIFDRGDGAADIMDTLASYHSFDIEWGNHDILWMGAAAGQAACIANVVRICARYGNMATLEEDYGINLLPLATFAERTYGDDPCTQFGLKLFAPMNPAEERLQIQMHKAISIIQFKLEGQLVREQTSFRMEERDLLSRMDFATGTVRMDGKDYPLLDTNFPTVDPEDPLALSDEEILVMERLRAAFLGCERLQKHIQVLLNNGALYKVYNGNLLYHGCVPLGEDGTLKEVAVYGERLRGKALYDALDQHIRRAYSSADEAQRKSGADLLWWLWCGKDSPLFGRDKMATFERYFLAEKETHEEKKSVYFALQDDAAVMGDILKDFGLTSADCRIINGHVPVKQGENPIKADGKLIVIDGGFSKAYQKVTAIAGYTLIYNSHGMRLVAHSPFDSRAAAVRKGLDIHESGMEVTSFKERMLVGDTDNGTRLKQRIAELEELLTAYRSGEIAER